MKKLIANIQPLDPMETGVGRLSSASQLFHTRGTAPRTLECYALVYLTRGEARFRDALGTDETIRAGQGFLLFPGIEHEYSTDENNDWDEFHVFFEGSAFDLWREQGLLDPARPIFSCEPTDRWTLRLQQVWNDAANPLDQLIRFQGFLMSCGLIATATRRNDPENQWLEQAREGLTETLDDPDGIENTAQKLGLSHQTFRKTFRRLQGCPPGRYRAFQTMENAARRLLTETTPIKQISDELGFCDEFHFARRFKLLMGSTPAAYRARLFGIQSKSS
jgi:AraC-like DNA-binding protein